MKFLAKTALASFVILAGSMSVANANTGGGEVRFSGSIHNGACSITAESASQDRPLGALSKAMLENGGRSAGKEFYIELEGCDLSSLTDKTVTTTFTGAGDPLIPGSLALNGEASGAGIYMEHGGKRITLGVPTDEQLIQDGDNTLAFTAYVQGADDSVITPIVTGSFSAVTNFTLAYQ